MLKESWLRVYTEQKKASFQFANPSQDTVCADNRDSYLLVHLTLFVTTYIYTKIQ